MKMFQSPLWERKVVKPHTVAETPISVRMVYRITGMSLSGASNRSVTVVSSTNDETSLVARNIQTGNICHSHNHDSRPESVGQYIIATSGR